MRTTLEIDDSVLAAARVLAGQRGISLGAAVSEYARRGLQAVGTTTRSGFPVFGPVAGGHMITDELVAEHRDD
ncbi:MAG: antitoxin [Microlunatus sp.]